MDPLVAEAGIGDCFSPFYVENAFFGGNVDVTGLLVGEDIARAVQRHGKPADVFFIPSVVFNDDGVTLDGMTLDDMEKTAGQTLHMVSCTPANYFNEIGAIFA